MVESKGIKVTNLQIWVAPGAMNALAQNKFPIRTSLALAKLSNKLNELRKPIDEARVGLVKHYGEKDAHGQFSIPSTVKDPEQPELTETELKAGKLPNMVHNVKLDEFQKEFDELMTAECETEVIAEKIKLPEMVAATCDKCHHNMERLLEIEPSILAVLDPFVEVADARK